MTKLNQEIMISGQNKIFLIAKKQPTDKIEIRNRNNDKELRDRKPENQLIQETLTILVGYRVGELQAGVVHTFAWFLGERPTTGTLFSLSKLELRKN